jgi:DNA-binding NarL/FixJ family response regulator
MAIRLIIADSASIHCELLSDAVKRDRLIQVVGSVSTKQELFELSAGVEFDIVLIALQMDESGFERCDIVRELRRRFPSVRTILMLDTSQREFVVEALRAGARGVFPKDGTLKMLRKCVRKVYEGHIWATASELSSTLDAVAVAPEIRAVDAKKQDLLSKREREVVSAVAEGLTNREIGERLGLSKHTVKNYLLHVFDKLGVSNRVELLFLALSQAQPSEDNGDRPSTRSSQSPLKDVLNGAAMGSADAQLKLANCFCDGLFVPRSLASAYMWCLVAEKSSRVLASQSSAKKQELMRSLSHEEIAQAESDAQLWRNQLELLESSLVANVHPISHCNSALKATA